MQYVVTYLELARLLLTSCRFMSLRSRQYAVSRLRPI